MKKVREFWRVESTHFCAWFDNEEEAMRSAGYYAEKEPTFTYHYVEHAELQKWKDMCGVLAEACADGNMTMAQESALEAYRSSK